MVATSEAMTATQLDHDDVEIIEPNQERYVRAPGDLIRVLAAMALFLVTLLAAAILRRVIIGAEEDVSALTTLVPGPVAQLLTAIAGTMGYVGPVAVAVTLLAIRRLRVALMVVAAGILAGLGMWLVSELLASQVVLPANLGSLRAIQFPGTRWVASASAIVTALNPWLPRPLRRAGIAVVAIVAFARIASGQYVPYEVAVAIVLGWLIGVVTLALFGTVNRRPAGSAVVEALRRAGIDVCRLEVLGRGVRGSTVYRAEDRDGRRSFIKVLSADQRDTDLLVQFYRWARLRDAADERPFSTLRRAVEHEALLALKAESDGIPTARMFAVAEVDPEGMLLAFEYLDGEPLDGAGPERLTDDLLRKVWAIAGQLRERHIAHRDLRLAHIMVPSDGRPAVVDFSFGELAAHPVQLRTDAAELLCSTAAEVGAVRAVAAAADVLGPDVLGDISGRLQPLALSRETRKVLSRQPGLLAEVQSEVQRTAGLDEVRYEELERIKPRTVVTVLVMAAALYLLLPQLAEVSDIGGELSRANWIWVVPLVVFMIVTWLGAALSMVGSVPDRLPFFPMLGAQVAASFVDTLAPASVGGMALNTRFMQKRGVDPAVAVAGVGLNAVAGFVVHLLLLGVFALWAGTSESATDSGPALRPPSARTTLLVLGVLVAIAVAGWMVPATRRLVRRRFVPLVRDAARGMAELARKPRKLVALFGGSAMVTLGFWAALLCAIEAFGGGPSPAEIGVAYLAASAVATVAPTPGGLGALEAAMIAAFQRLGISADGAVSSVFLFRVGTFWLPVLPGWITFGYLQRHGDL